MSERRSKPEQDELDAIQAELEALGEDLSDDLMDELALAERLASEVDEVPDERLYGEAPPERLDGLTALRLHGPASQLTDDRSEALLQGIHAALSGDGPGRDEHTFG